MCALIREVVRPLLERREVVDHPERAALRRGDEIVVAHGEIGDRHDRQIELQRLPVRAVVERDVHPALGAGEEESLAFFVGADNTREVIAGDHFTRVVRSDKKRKGLLFAGTERGMYVSFDDGANWQTLQLNLPIVPVTDLTVRDNDLVAATQGRAFWMIDDLSPLQQWSNDFANQRAHLFTPRSTDRKST